VFDMAGKKTGDWTGKSSNATVTLPGAASGIHLFVTKKGGATFTNTVMVR
jgi:hypothetical protein